ncbi:MAG: sodium:solute symporter family protein, partial [Chlorobiales bacterium]|nr:sodium:solute symporter family protein [Chlorobiales bacterium]
QKSTIRLSMIITFIVGTAAVILAARFTTVLNAILYTYSFMVSGLFVPTIGAYFWPKGSSTGALSAMIGGGALTVLLMTGVISLPDYLTAMKLDATFYGIVVSALLYITLSLFVPDRQKTRIAVEP